MGGSAGTTVFNTLEVYDPATNTWTAKTGMPTARWGLGVVALNGKLYAVGGGIGNGSTNTLEVYATPEPNAWASNAPMPTARGGLAAAELNGKLYAVGGFDGASNLNNLEVYDPVNNQWVIKKEMPTARTVLAAAAINGKLYTVGGTESSTLGKKLQVYDPVTDQWEDKLAMPTGRRSLAAAAINGKLYVVGGYHPSQGTFDKLEIYDPVTNTWDTSKQPMLMAREGLAAAAINGKLYVVGGRKGNGSYVNTLEVYDPVTDQWITKQGMETARWFPAAAEINGKLYVVGGSNGGGFVNDLEVYDPATDQWMSKPVVPTRRGGLAATALNGKLYAVGGINGSPLNTLEVFQVASDLTLAKSHTGNFTAGTGGSYTLTVSNAAEANCTEGAITVTDTLPNELSYVSASGTGWNCSANGQTVTCTNTSLTLDAGESASLTLNVQANAAGSVTNHAEVATSDEIVTDNNSANSGNGDQTTILCPTPATLPTMLPNGTGGTAYSASVAASPGGTYFYSFAGNFPPGLMLNPNTGAITGVPAFAGTVNFLVLARRFGSCLVSQLYIVNIACPRSIGLLPNQPQVMTSTGTFTSLPAAKAGIAYQTTISATPNGGNYTFSLIPSPHNLPPGLTLNPNTGVIEGTTTATGTYKFQIQARGFLTCANSRLYLLQVNEPTKLASKADQEDRQITLARPWLFEELTNLAVYDGGSQ